MTSEVFETEEGGESKNEEPDYESAVEEDSEEGEYESALEDWDD